MKLGENSQEAIIGTGERRGIMTAQADGYIYGLFSYYAGRNLEYGDTLIVENLAVLDLLTPKAVAAALVCEMDSLMAQLECRAIQTVLPNGKRLTPASRRSIVGRFFGAWTRGWRHLPYARHRAANSR